VLLFGVAGEWFALPLDRVREVCPRAAITRVPRAPSQVLGVMNLRGQPVVLVDLPRCLNLPGGGPDAPQVVLLDLGDQDLAVGLLADRIDQVVEVEAQGPAGGHGPEGPGGEGGPELVELGGHVATVLDPIRLLGPALPGVASGGSGEAA
jgi:purine-binding chemotaxis protein CheW